MQSLIFEFGLLVSLSFIIGLSSSMVGISGGVFRTPLLIIVFGLTAQFSTAVSLFAVLFLAIPSSIEYNRNEKKPIMFKFGLLIALLATPGLFLGVVLKSMIIDDYILRIIFGICLSPIALMMLMTKRKSNGTDCECDVSEYNIADNSNYRLIIAGFACFIAGIAGALLGLGGGAIIVPVLCIVLSMPMLVAAATSVFSMIFISISGTIMNLTLIPQIDSLSIFIFYTVALAIGKIVGGKIGANYACKVDGVLLRRLFGVVLIFPLIHLMSLGQLWLDPLGTSLLVCTIGDIILWILIVIPFVAVWVYWRRDAQTITGSPEVIIVETKGS